jgi:hypothetical protein
LRRARRLIRGDRSRPMRLMAILRRMARLRAAPDAAVVLPERDIEMEPIFYVLADRAAGRNGSRHRRRQSSSRLVTVAPARQRARRSRASGPFRLRRLSERPCEDKDRPVCRHGRLLIGLPPPGLFLATVALPTSSQAIRHSPHDVGGFHSFWIPRLSSTTAGIFILNGC